jgi:hypothetical protein
MFTIKKDEREHKIESISERNAAWAMICTILIAVGYQSFNTVYYGMGSVDIFLIIVLLVGVIVKSISNIVLERKQL